jgi:hydroxymethylglutaryl-CoA synthase
MINLKKFSQVDILGYGAYIPYFRLKTKAIAQSWHKKAEQVKQSLGVDQKAVAGPDEDSLTMAVEASLLALEQAKISPKKIGAVFVGSESHPYAVKPTGTILADILGMDNNYYCADLQFACKAATTGIAMAAAMIESRIIDYGLIVGTDKAQAEPGDVLEYTAAAGAVALILSKKSKFRIAKLKTSWSFNSDTPDFWRRPGCLYPAHTGRFTGEPAYFKHVLTCTDQFLKKTNKKISDFDHVVFHMPNSKFPLKAAKKTGVTSKQLELGFLVPHIGNPYSASSLMGLAAVLDKAKKNSEILLVSYGSGAGSDIFWFKKLRSLVKKESMVDKYLKHNQETDYLTYLKNYHVV